MNEIIILTAGDIHVSDINPRSRIDNFKETIIGKIEQLKTAAAKLKADAVLLTGDLYNIKFPMKNSHDLNRELIEIFNKFKCPVYAIPGNHDLTADNLDTIPSQPIGVLYASGALKNLNQEIINKKGFKVSLVGIPFTKDIKLNKITIPPKEDCVAQICVLHVYAGPKAGKLYKEQLYGYDELAALGPDIFVIGHYHTDQGIQWNGKKCFINLGSISRGVLAEDKIDHKPKFGFIKVYQENKDSEVKITVDSIPLKIKPPEEIFDLKKHSDEKQQSQNIQEYVEHLVSEASSKTGLATVEDHLKNMKVEKEIMDLVMELIMEARLSRQ